MAVGPTPRPRPAACLYVYGIVERSAHSVMDGATLREERLSTTVVGRVAAVHSLIDPAELEGIDADIEEGSRLASLVRRHDAIVQSLHAAGPVLPVRLGTLLPDEDALTRLLRESEGDIVRALDRVRDHDEWDLRVTAADRTDDPQQEQPRTGTDYLMGRRAARERETQHRESTETAVRGLDEQLQALAAGTAGSASAFGGVVLARSYLVARAGQDAFVAAAEQGIDELHRLGCTAVLRGPLAPYAFADVRLELEGVAP